MDDQFIAAGGRHGVVGGHIPDRDDWVIPQNWDQYTKDDHEVWRDLYERQAGLLPGRACNAYLQGMAELPILPFSIPNFDDLSEVLMRRTGWQIVAVPGMVPNDVFFDHLANRRFPAGQFIRGRHELDYLQEPDVFHDIFGHVPMMMNPVMADFMQAYGEGAKRADRLGLLDYLARLYWYTVEFGLVEQSGKLRIFGAGILSSFSETQFALESPSPSRLGFDLKRVMRTHYRIDAFQESYFVLPSVDSLLDLVSIDFMPIYEDLRDLEALPAGTVEPTDLVFSRGTAAHHSTQG